MNWQHLKTFLWLRWRLRVNQFRRAGALNAVLLGFVAVMAALAAAGLFVAGFLVGLFALPKVPPAVHLFVWDGVVGVFLFFWLIGLLTDLQRAEGLALDKVLHLPVSPAGGFLINYLSSLFSLTLIACIPGMVGLVLGQTFAEGPVMLLALPLLAAFILAVTAVTYQFQGWLASLMTNPRRRRTVIVVVTAAIILLAQAPQLLNLARPRNYGPDESDKIRTQQREENLRARGEKKITPDQFQAREKEIQKEYDDRREEASRQTLDRAERTARLLSLVIPPGWLPLGAADLANGDVLPALLGTLGFGLIGGFSLWRAYRTTVRMYTGDFNSGSSGTVAKTPGTPKARTATPRDPSRVALLERRLPWVSEHASAVGLAAFRSLSRAPEAKMALLAPAIMVVVFGGLSFSLAEGPPRAVRPLMAFGAAAMVLLISGVQLVGNQFGYDRAGFRAYVLSPAPRREILLGKNLAVAPLALGLGLVGVLLVGIVYPMRIDHYPAALIQMVTAYLVFSLMANALSIFAPIPMAAGSMQPASIKAGPVLLQMLFIMFIPLAMIPVLLPIGVEALVEELSDIRGLPISLLLSLVILAIVAFVYRRGLTIEGDWLAVREQKILEVVTSKAE